MSEWLDVFRQSPEGSDWPNIKSNNASDAIQRIGTNAAPVLAHWLTEGAVTEDRIESIRKKFPFLQPITEPLRKRAQRKAARGMCGLQILGTNATAAIPILKDAFRTHKTFNVINDTLGALGHIEPPTTNGSYE